LAVFLTWPEKEGEKEKGRKIITTYRKKGGACTQFTSGKGEKKKWRVLLKRKTMLTPSIRLLQKRSPFPIQKGKKRIKKIPLT